MIALQQFAERVGRALASGGNLLAIFAPVGSWFACCHPHPTKTRFREKPDAKFAKTFEMPVKRALRQGALSIF